MESESFQKESLYMSRSVIDKSVDAKCAHFFYRQISVPLSVFEGGRGRGAVIAPME